MKNKCCHLCGSKTVWYKRYTGPITVKDPFYNGYQVSFDGNRNPIYHTPTHEEYVFFCNKTEYIAYKISIGT